jgi:hypothetical protein
MAIKFLNTVQVDTDVLYVDAANDIVGIGTTSLGAKLHVAAGTGNPTVLLGRATGQASIKAGTDNSGHLIIDSSTGHVYINNYVNKNIYLANGGGNVGIGTTSPGYKLDVNSASAVGARISTTGFTNLDLVSSRTSGNLGGLRFKQDIDAAQTGEFLGLHGGGFDWKVGDGSVAPDIKMRLDSSGNLGIGTTNPIQKLHLHNSATLTATYQKFTNGTATTGTTLGIDADGDFLINNSEAKEIKLYTNDSQRVTISSAGAVKFNTYSAGTLVTDASGNITATTTPPGTGVFVPLAGGSSTGEAMTGTLYGPGATFSVSGNNSSNLKVGDGSFRMEMGRSSIQARVVGASGAASNLNLNPNGGDVIFSGSGNVGIGTTSPGAKLDVDGVIRSRGGTYIADIDTKTDVGLVIPENDFIYTADGSSYLRKLIGKTSDIIRIGEAGTSLISGINLTPGTTGGYVQVFNNSSVAAKFVDGKLGLGTINPTADLHIQGSSATDLPILRVGGFGDSGSKLELAEALTSGDMNYGYSFFNDGNSSNTLIIKAHNNSTTGITAMTIDRGNALTTFGPVPVVGTRTAGDNTTRAASTAFVTSAVAGVPIGDYVTLATDQTISGTKTFSEGPYFNGTTYWRVSSADAALQRADARDDGTNYSRLHWYGVSDTGATSNFRHAYYDGANYISVTAASGKLTFGGYVTATRLQVGDGTDGYFYSDSAGRTAYTGGDFYIQSNVGNAYNYAANNYHGSTSGDNQFFRGNPLSGDNWSITAAGAATFTTVTGTNGTFSGTVAGGVSTSNVDGQANIPFKLGVDYNSYMVAAAGNTWGLFWAGSSGARYGTNGNGGPGNIWGNITNPNEFAFVGSDSTAWTVYGTNGNVWQKGDLWVNGGDITLGGTGRIQGVDTVSAGTDAANKTYVDAQGTNFLENEGGFISGDTLIEILETDTTADVRTKLNNSSGSLVRIDDHTAPAGGCFQLNNVYISFTLPQYHKLDDDQEYTFELWAKFISGTDTDQKTYLGSSFYGSTKNYLGNSQRYWGESGFNIDSNTNNDGWYFMSGTLGPARGGNTGEIPNAAHWMKLIMLLNYSSNANTMRYCGLKVYKSGYKGAKKVTSIYRKPLGSQASSSAGQWIGDVVMDTTGALHAPNITLADGIYHKGDTNTYINFLTDTIQMATAGSPRVYINSAGDVGIGTNAPTTGRKLDVHGDIEVTEDLFIGATGSSRSEHKIKIGQNRSGNGYAYIDLIGDAAATSYYSLRLIRNHTGANATSQIIHTGTGNFSIDASDGANIILNPGTAKVGIGTTNPSYKLDVSGNARFSSQTTHTGGLVTSGSQTRNKISVWSSLSSYTIGMKSGYGYGGLGGDGTGTDYAMSFQMSNTANRGWWWGDTSHSDLQGAMSLTTQGKLVVATSIKVGAGESTGSAGTSKLTVVTPLGGIGADFQITSGSGYGTKNVRVAIPAYGDGIQLTSIASSSIDNNAITFYQDANKRGSIVVNTTSTSYNTTSDYRLKENKEIISDAIERVKALKPVKFNWISEPSQPKMDGFYAHELAEVVPEAVTGEKDALDHENNPDYQSIDQSKIVPLLSAALQQAIDKIEELEQRIQLIENK